MVSPFSDFTMDISSGTDSFSSRSAAFAEGAAVGDGTLQGILAAYRRDGFDAGYWRGINDTLASLALAAEESLAGQNGNAAALRTVIQQIYAKLEREVGGRQHREDFVENGLGI